MAPSLDYCAASLLCCEESGCFSDEGRQGNGECSLSVYSKSSRSWLGMELQEPFDAEAAISVLAKREIFHQPLPDYAEKFKTKILDPGTRHQAINWLFKVRAFFNFSPLTVALSVNYLDRFLSCHELPSGKSWLIQLLSVACLSLAAKMEEVDVPLLLDLQVAPECYFEPHTVQRMELLVLSSLEWRMSSVTPFAYVEYFVSKFDLDSSSRCMILSRINELIICAAQELRFLSYRPTSISAAAVLCAAQEVLPLQLADFKRILLSMIPAEVQDPSEMCFKLMSDIFLPPPAHRLLKDENFTASAPRSPSGVLDASFSCDSESIFKSAESDPNIQISSPVAKKRKVEEFCSSMKVRAS